MSPSSFSLLASASRRLSHPALIALKEAQGRRISYSQLGEDVWIMRNYMNLKRDDLTCMEVGAYEPFIYSNTYAFEKSFHAKSILIEPSLSRAAKIQRKRPTASLYCAVASNDYSLCSFLGDSAVAGIETGLTDDYIDQWNLSTERRRWIPAVPVHAIQSAENLSYLDLLSVDVQGAELEVLRGIDWSCPIGLVCIELEGADPRKDAACREFLKAKGYRLRFRMEINEFWVLPDYSRRGLIWSPDAIPRVDSFYFPYLEPHASARVLLALNQDPKR